MTPHLLDNWRLPRWKANFTGACFFVIKSRNIVTEYQLNVVESKHVFSPSSQLYYVIVPYYHY